VWKGQEVQKQIEEKTKATDPWQILDIISKDFERHDAQLKWVLEGSPGKRLDLDLEQIPEAERIEAANGRTYTKYDSRQDLLALDEFLNEDSANWIEYEKYQMLGSWLTAKEHYGADCYGPPPLKEKEIEVEIAPDLQKQPELDKLLGFDDNERTIDERSNPLLNMQEPSLEHSDDLATFLGFDPEQHDIAEQSFNMVEIFGVPDQDNSVATDERDDDSEHLFEIGWQ